MKFGILYPTPNDSEGATEIEVNDVDSYETTPAGLYLYSAKAGKQAFAFYSNAQIIGWRIIK